jgi:4-amino-4-deoxy-L-arabinose transferase-like glycosyltransferase
MFAGTVGTQVSWLLPAAVALLVVGLWLTRRAPRTDPVRASLLLWGLWTVVTALVFSFAAGIFHDYYTVALAPGGAGLVGVGGRELWRRHGSVPARVTEGVLLAGTAAWAWVLLGRSPEFLPWLRWAVVVAAAVGVVLLLAARSGRRWLVAGGVAVAVAAFAGPAAYAAETVATPTGGSLPLAGPAVIRDAGGGFGGLLPGGPTPGGPGDVDPATTDPALVALLRQASTRWSAATVGAQNGAPLALASGTDVMTIGGFLGTDPAPTLEQFQAAVAAGEIRYFVVGTGPGPGADPDRLLEQAPASVREDPRFQEFLDEIRSGRGPMSGGTASAVSTWVQGTFTPVTVGGTTVYDLAQPRG